MARRFSAIIVSRWTMSREIWAAREPEPSAILAW
jgi:hypothetical protein